MGLILLFVLAEKVVRARAGRKCAGDHLHVQRQAPLLHSWQCTHRRQVWPGVLGRSLRVSSRIQCNSCRIPAFLIPLLTTLLVCYKCICSVLRTIQKLGAISGASSDRPVVHRAVEATPFHLVPSVGTLSFMRSRR